MVAVAACAALSKTVSTSSIPAAPEGAEGGQKATVPAVTKLRLDGTNSPVSRTNHGSPKRQGTWYEVDASRSTTHGQAWLNRIRVTLC